MNYYEILQIDTSASLHDIKKAYRKRALQCHPDKNNNSEESTEQFKQISIAYQVLSDPIQRSMYDHTGTADTNMDFMSSLDLFKLFFKEYNPKIFNIIEKTYERITDKLEENDEQTLMDILYNIEKKDIIKDTGSLMFDYVNEYVQDFFKHKKKEKVKKYTYTYNELIDSPVINISLPLEYYVHNPYITIHIYKDNKSTPLQLQTIFKNHTITIQNQKCTFTLLDQPHSTYSRINQYDIYMQITIGLQDYIDGFQFSYNYIDTFIDKSILLSKYASCFVLFEDIGLHMENKKKGRLIIEYKIQHDVERLFEPPTSDDFMYSVTLKDILKS